MNAKISIKKKKLIAGVVAAVVVIGLFLIIPLLGGALHNTAEAAEGPVRYHGDVDGDGEVSAADARLSLRACVGLEDYAPGSYRFVHADYDGDGEISASDARMILRTAVGLEPLIESTYTDPEDPTFGPTEELPLTPEDEARLRAEEEAKKKDHEQEPAPSEAEPQPVKPIYQGDGVNTCLYCGKPCSQDEYGNNACAFGGCTRSSFADWTCIHCGESVPMGICHTCTNPTYIITELPKK